MGDGGGKGGCGARRGGEEAGSVKFSEKRCEARRQGNKANVVLLPAPPFSALLLFSFALLGA